MTFELSDSARNDIMFAMENQEARSVFDAASGQVRDGDGLAADEKTLYSLPKWTSDDGYALMEDFTQKCYSPLARAELRECLQSGKGVFKGFKNVLKAYPLIEKRWYLYKSRAMGSVINEWYNGLREVWGLELLNEDDESETDDILEEDFSFEEYDASRDNPETEAARNAVFGEILDEDLDPSLSDALLTLRERQAEFFLGQRRSGFVCRTYSKEFLGCALVSNDGLSSKRTYYITDFFVIRNYRGLGIGQHLLNLTLAALKEKGARYVVASHPFINPPMEGLLEKSLFKKQNRDYILDLSDNNL